MYPNLPSCQYLVFNLVSGVCQCLIYFFPYYFRSNAAFYGNGALVIDTSSSDGDDTVTFALTSVASGRSGSVTFKATVASSADAGIIENVATQTVNNVDFPPSNTASIVVDSQFSVDISDQSPDGSTTSATDDDAANDTVLEDGLDGAGDMARLAVPTAGTT